MLLPDNYLQIGSFVNYPRPILTDYIFKCPICEKRWEKRGSGYGFVKASINRHVASCYEKLLTKRGLKMKQPYNMKKLGWKLVSISKVYSSQILKASIYNDYVP